ncbi:MAG: hemolysin III family protein [Bacilli bacterium]|jgi:hemolysin III
MSVTEFKTSFEKQSLPKYSDGEEVFNWVSHAVGVLIGLITLGYFIAMAVVMNFTAIQTLSLIFYSLSIVLLYATSTIYHALNKTSTWKKIFRLLDHNTIYLLIAGSYAPICAFAFGGTYYGIIIFSIQLVGLLTGTIMNFLNLNGKVTQIITVVLYVVMGWLLVIFYPAISHVPFLTTLFVLLGGVSYTSGVIFYAIGRKIKWMHSVFHLFVLIGTIVQLVGIILLIN